MTSLKRGQKLGLALVPTISVAFAVAAANGVIPHGARVQSAEEPSYQTGITGNAPSGPLNPTTMMNDSAVRALILRLTENALSMQEVEKQLTGQPYAVKDMVEAGLARVDEGLVRLALNYVSADDQRLIASRAREYGRELAERVLAHRADIETAVVPLAATDDERRAILFFLVGCMALDWEGLGYTQKAGYRAGATVEGPGFAYTPWMKENAPDISRRGLYWGSHNQASGAYTFTTFGDHDALPRVALPDLFFSLRSPFPTLETSEGALAGRRLVGAYSGAILSDVAGVLLAIHDGAGKAGRIEAVSGVAARSVASILSLLETIDFVRREADGYVLQITVLTEEARPAAERIVTVVRDAMEAWHERRYEKVKLELADLTALRQGVPFEVVYTEIWHYVFGYANLFLSESGLISDPYTEGARFRGFLPYLWASSVDASW